MAKKNMNKKGVISSKGGPPMDSPNPIHKNEQHAPTEIRHVKSEAESTKPGSAVNEGETCVSPSSTHDKVRSWTSIIGCLVTIVGVIIACIQLSNVAKTISLSQAAERNVEDREIMWATTRMIETFLLSPVLIEGRTAIYQRSYKGENTPSDYTWLDDPTAEMVVEAAEQNKKVEEAELNTARESAKLRRAALNNLNFLDLIATGVMQGIYNEEIVRDNLEPSLKRYVKVFIKGEDDKSDWRTKKIKEFDESYFPQLINLYNSWNELPRTHFEKSK